MRSFCCTQAALTACFILLEAQLSNGFVQNLAAWHFGRRNLVRCRQSDDKTSSYETSDASSKGIVSSLTGLLNFIMNPKNKDGALSMPSLERPAQPPTSAVELMSRIRDDYSVNNYLWTGDIDLAAFEKDCRFTDPTLSFVGKDKFVSNVQNLRVIVDNLIEPGDCRSDLLEISVNEEEQYVHTRWNMVGKLNRLPWRPMINVVGRTKFWYRTSVDNGYRVYFYDECWELPAAKALLQLVTPAGTIPNSSEAK